MNNYIQILLDFFHDYADELSNNKIILNIKKKQISIDYLSNNKKGDIASNFFLIIRDKIIDNKYNFSDELEKKIINLSFIYKFEISKNGFINFFLKSEFILEQLNIIYEKKFYEYIKFGNNKNINIEFVSANPTGPIHIAHIRGAIFGDVLSSLYNKMGFKVTREYYVNDAGSQIEKLANSLYKRYLELFNKKIEILDDEYPGEYLIDIAKEIFLKDKDKWLNTNHNEYYSYFKTIAVNKLLNQIKKDLKLIDVKFDIFTHETSIVERKIINKLFKILEKKNLIYEGILPKPKTEDIEWEPRKQLLFRSSKLDDDQDRAFKKSNGEWTYFANDAAYHYDKYNRKFDKLINIWGSDHIGYIPRMKSILNSIQNNNKNYFEVLTCQIVSLIQNKKKIKMSKREGNFVTLVDVFNKVGKDPIRYYMISTKNETAIDFDLDLVIKKNKDNNVFYCQYAYARASSIINKAIESNITISNTKDINLFNQNITNEELSIIKLIISYPYILYQSAFFNEPHRLVNYLELLCSNFHSIWNKGRDNTSLRFIDKKNIDQTKIKLFWIENFRIILKDIFNIIGINAPERM